MPLPGKIKEMMNKGVRITDPFSVEIGPEVMPERISAEGVVLFGGSRIYGAHTLLSPGVKIGSEGPATVVDCQLAPRAELKGGFFHASVFLEGVCVAAGAHVREGSLLEEEVRVGHTAGLKQTILFPFVTLGSLINFCDCLMAGGTGRENHSEVGSSYVHFNYTPQQDKATASLIGDVPRGVMLDQPPIFLGGQGGLVGPLLIDYGTVTTAGTVWRRDSQGGKMLHGSIDRSHRQEYTAGLYGDIRRKVTNNIIYIANLRALGEWYGDVRRPFFLKQQFGEMLFHDVQHLLGAALQERLKQFRLFANKMYDSAAIGARREAYDRDVIRRQQEFATKWPDIEEHLQAPVKEESVLKDREAFLGAFFSGKRMNDTYLEAIRTMDGDAKRAGTRWLQGIVDHVTAGALQKLPSFSSYEI